MAYRFRYILALALGKTLREIDAIDSCEFQEWLNFYSVSPFGDVRDDMRGGLLCSIVANVMGSKTKPSDFIPDLFSDRPAAPALASAESLLASMRAIRAGL